MIAANFVSSTSSCCESVREPLQEFAYVFNHLVAGRPSPHGWSPLTVMVSSTMIWSGEVWGRDRCMYCLQMARLTLPWHLAFVVFLGAHMGAFRCRGNMHLVGLGPSALVRLAPLPTATSLVVFFLGPLAPPCA